MLLVDCCALWDVAAKVDVAGGMIEVATAEATFRLERAAGDMLPVRWLLHRPGRSPRALPSIVAALTALRNALGGDAGNRLRIGTS
jgi:hypothetical protein